MHEVITKVKSAAEKEHNHIADQPVEAVAPKYQCNRQFNILRVKDGAELAVHISDIHVQKSIKSYRISKKNVHQQSAEKTDQKPCLLPAHKSKGSRQNNQQVRHDSAERQSVEHGTLQQKTYEN